MPPPRPGPSSNFVQAHEIRSVIEFGCGDGNQLSLADYPRYIGLDVSRSAIELCKRRFAGDVTKSFFLYDGTCFADRAGLFTADLAISLDVIYHLTEEAIFEAYMAHLFGARGKVRDRLRHQPGNTWHGTARSNTVNSPGGWRRMARAGGCWRSHRARITARTARISSPMSVLLH